MCCWSPWWEELHAICGSGWALDPSMALNSQMASPWKSFDDVSNGPITSMPTTSGGVQLGLLLHCCVAHCTEHWCHTIGTITNPERDTPVTPQHGHTFLSSSFLSIEAKLLPSYWWFPRFYGGVSDGEDMDYAQWELLRKWKHRRPWPRDFSGHHTEQAAARSKPEHIFGLTSESHCMHRPRKGLVPQGISQRYPRPNKACTGKQRDQNSSVSGKVKMNGWWCW